MRHRAAEASKPRHSPNTYWVPDRPFGRQYDIAADGSALLSLEGATLGRELGIILNFDVLVQRKLAEANGVETGSGGPP